MMKSTRNVSSKTIQHTSVLVWIVKMARLSCSQSYSWSSPAEWSRFTCKMMTWWWKSSCSTGWWASRESTLSSAPTPETKRPRLFLEGTFTRMSSGKSGWAMLSTYWNPGRNAMRIFSCVKKVKLELRWIGLLRQQTNLPWFSLSNYKKIKK